MTDNSDELVKATNQNTIEWLDQIEKLGVTGYDPEFHFLVKVTKDHTLQGRNIEVSGADEIKEFCQNLTQFQKQIGEQVVGVFNDVRLVCDTGTLPEGLIGFYRGYLRHQFLASEGLVEVPQSIHIIDLKP